MDVNLLVSYDPKAGYMGGKNEIHDVLTKIGDQKSVQELLVPGIIGVKTKLDARQVVEDVRELFLADPLSLNSTLKWVPVDAWCDASVQEIVKIVKDDVKDLITSDDLYAVEFIKHRGELHHDEVVDAVVSWIKGKVNLERPQKIIRIELFDKKASVTLLRPKDVFSIAKT
ncbi:hypothetical protein KY309_00905 [Candidatus Woesearchaeota archaeon]|nr:hypothetical protein [Candidatus Woesearchaeota archaeon]MBW3016153.1 hypothetical protein [Candidatus Woesearchaeota archaeon]